MGQITAELRFSIVIISRNSDWPISRLIELFELMASVEFFNRNIEPVMLRLIYDFKNSGDSIIQLSRFGPPLSRKRPSILTISVEWTLRLLKKGYEFPTQNFGTFLCSSKDINE